MKHSTIGLAAAAFVLGISVASGATLKWAGMRSPCKQSAEDGVTDKDLGKKIGKFITLETKEQWGQTILNVSGRFQGAKPWVTWAVGQLKDATPLSDQQHEEYLTYMDQQGIEVYLELWPIGADVPQLIDTWLGKLKQHKCVAGVGVDLEYFKPLVDDALAKSWDEKIKSYNPKYRMFLKHWEMNHMPPNYRGKGDIIFINTSSEASMDALNKEFAEWADHFAPSAVAFQIGYPADEDAMDGTNKTGWWTLNDPIKEWTEDLIKRIKSPEQEVGILWVTAKSGKTYNTKWDLTKGPAAP